MTGRGAIEKYTPIRNRPPCFNTPPIATDVLKDIPLNATEHCIRPIKRHTEAKTHKGV